MSDERPPDVEISAVFRAKELRFECKPEVELQAYSDRLGSAEKLSKRENLPDEVDPGVIYNDVAALWRLAELPTDLVNG